MMARPHTMPSRSCRRENLNRMFADVMFSDVMLVPIFAGIRNLRNRVEQRSHQPARCRARDKMRGLLPAKRPAEHARKTQHRATAAAQTTRRVVFAKQFTLHAK